MSLLPHQSRVGKLQRGIVSFLVLLVALTPAATLVPQEARADTHPADEFIASLDPDMTAAGQSLHAVAKDVSQRLRSYNSACGLSTNPNFLNLYTNAKNGTPTENIRIIDCLMNSLRAGYYQQPLPENNMGDDSYYTGVSWILGLAIDKKLFDDEATRSQSQMFVEVKKEDGSTSVGFTDVGKEVWSKYLNAKKTYSTHLTAVYMALFILQKANIKDPQGNPKNVTEGVGNNDPASAEVDVHRALVSRQITLYPREADATHRWMWKKWTRSGFAKYACENDVIYKGIHWCSVGNTNRAKKSVDFYAGDFDPKRPGLAQDEGNLWLIDTGRYTDDLGWEIQVLPYEKIAPGDKTIKGLPTSDFQAWLQAGSRKVPADILQALKPVEGTIQSFKSGYYDPYFNFNIETGEGGEFVEPIAMAAKAAGLPMQGSINDIPVPDDLTSGTGRCGKAPGWNEFGLWIPYSFCNMTTYIQGFGLNMLNYSFNFLGATANIEALKGSTLSFAEELTTAPERVLVSTEGSTGTMGNIVRRANTMVLNLLNSAVVIFLVLVALANILQINMNSYAVKKVLPGIIIGFLLAQFATFFMRASLEVTGALTGSVLTSEMTLDEDDGTGGMENMQAVVEVIGSYDGNPDAKLTDDNDIVDSGKVGQQFVLNIFVLIAVVLVFILAFLFLLRNLIFFVLTPLAPVAVFGKFFQPLAGITGRWWKLFISWLFMPLVAAFWLWLGFVWLASANLPQGGQGLALDSPTFAQYLFSYVVGMGCFFLAMKTPFTMAGEAKNLVDRWNKIGKSAFKATGVPALGKAGSELGKTAYSRQVTQRLHAGSAGSWWHKNITQAEANRKRDLKYAEEKGIRYHIAEKKFKQLGDIEADAAKKKSAVEEAINKRRTTAQADYEAKLKELEETYSSGGAQAQAMLERGRARLKEEHDKILAGLATELATEKRNIDTNFEVKKLNLLRGVREGAARDAIRKARQEIEAEKKRLKEEAKRNQAWADAVNSKNDPHP